MTFWEAVIHLQCGRQLHYTSTTSSFAPKTRYKLINNTIWFKKPHMPSWQETEAKIRFISKQDFTLVPVGEET